MAATFVVTLREGFEAALLLGIVYACLDRFGARQHYRWVTLGGALGLVASVLMGIAVTFLSGPLLDLGPDLVGAAVIFAAVGLLTWHGWWMSRHAHAMRSDVQRRVAEAEATRQLSILGLIAFTGVFREGAETVLFLWGLMSQTAEGASWWGLAGGVPTGLVGYRARPTLVEVTGYMLYLITAGALFLGGRRAIGARSGSREPTSSS